MLMMDFYWATLWIAIFLTIIGIGAIALADVGDNDDDDDY